MILNVAPVSFADATVRVGRQPFKDKDQLRSLRIAYGETYFFRRDRDGVVCVPLKEGAEPIGVEIASVRLYDQISLCAALVKTAVLRHIRNIPRKVTDYQPIRFLADKSDENLLAKACPASIACPDWLAVRPEYECDVRVFWFDKQKPFVGLALNVHTARQIILPCSELLEKGLSLQGHYVGRSVQRGGPDIAPSIQSVGRVDRIEGGTIHLVDARDGVQTIEAAEAFLESRPDAFQSCLAHAFGDRTTAVEARLAALRSELVTGPGRLDKVKRVVDYFSKRKLEMLPGIAFVVQPFLRGADTRFPQIEMAPAPVFVFDVAGRKTHAKKISGLMQYGPYSASHFTPSTPRMCVIGQALHKGRLEQFLHKFLHGIPAVVDKWVPFPNGFIKQYALTDVEVKFFLTSGDTANDYRRAALAAVEQAAQDNRPWNLALVEVDESTHLMAPAVNPYLITKAILHTHHIPVQEFETETMEQRDGQLGYTLSNMALATYAKLNGVPWLIKADPTITHELVFGLGSAHVGEGRFGPRERVVGITTVFAGDGTYHLSSISRAVPMAQYGNALVESLRSTVQRVRADMNWQKGERVRLVFHVFKPFKDTEADTVKTVMGELGDYNVEYAFVHIADNHPYLLFDENQKGVPDALSRGVKGIMAPTRGQFFRLSRAEVVLCLTGAKELKQASDGLPRPVLLHLHRNSTFIDTTYLARQVFWFSDHSWQGFLPSSMPVTIRYSEMIARLLGKLSMVPGWNPDVMVGQIGASPWFL